MKKLLLISSLLFCATSFYSYSSEETTRKQSRYTSGKVHHINSESEFNAIIQSESNIIIDFYADWCNPCRRLSPILEKLAAENPNILFFKINFDNARNLSERYKIRGIPTLLLFRDGKKVEQITGLLNKSEYSSAFDRIFPR